MDTYDIAKEYAELRQSLIENFRLSDFEASKKAAEMIEERLNRINQ